MSATFDDLQILKTAETIADLIWKQVVRWDEFEKDVVGKQLTRAADSIGANIAESVGRYSFGEKLQFLYYSRGSLFETKYWLNRTQIRGLMNADDVQKYVDDLTSLARQLKSLSSGLKTVRSQQSNKKSHVARESSAEYFVAVTEELPASLFTDEDINLLNS